MPKHAIVTGGAGFIGSHVVDALLGDGWTVVAVDDLSTGTERNVPADAELEVVDVSDTPALDRVMDRVRPDSIFHLAAQASVTVSVQDPKRDCVVNVQGTLNVVEAAKRHRAPVVFTSTGGALYGNQAPIPTSEDRIPAPLAPYGASKWAAEAYILTWRAASDLPHAVCRLGNVYGPRQSPHGEAGVVAILSYQLWRGTSPTLYGHGQPTRDYVHVLDVARALIAANGIAGVFNIATGVETDVRTLYEEIRAAAGASAEPALAPLRPGELERSCLDPGSARSELGWSAEIPVDRGVRETYEALVQDFEAAT